MYSLTTWAFLAQLLLASANAQNSTTGTCQDIKYLARPWNSSTTRQIPALILEGENPRSGNVPTDSKYTLVNDSSKTWELSLRVQPQLWANGTSTPQDPGYLQHMFLDTKDSNTTDIGSCHQVMQSAVKNQGYLFSKAVLERAMSDNGDCTTMLGNECVQAIKKMISNEVANIPLRTGSCSGMNTTMPRECSGVDRTFSNRQMDLKYVNYELGGTSHPNSNFSADTECSGVNASSTHILKVTDQGMTYDDAVRMPIIDVVSFWPNRSTGIQFARNGWINDVRVEVFCLRSDEAISEGSTTPASGADLLKADSVKFPLSSGAIALRSGMLRWFAATVMGIMFVL